MSETLVKFGTSFQSKIIASLLSDKKFTTSDVRGLDFNPVMNKWRRSNNLSVNYIVCSLKN